MLRHTYFIRFCVPYSNVISCLLVYVLYGMLWSLFFLRNLYGTSCELSKTVVPVCLVVHVCRTVDRVVGHPRPSLSNIGVPWVSLLGPTDVP